MVTGKRKKKHRLPYWIRSQEFRRLSSVQKDFLGYLYSFGPDTCWLWNCRLQKKFHCSRSTIQRRLRKLKELGFIWIEKPFGPERKIHTRPMLTPQHWLSVIATITFSHGLRKDKRNRKAHRGYPEPIQPWHSPASIELARHAIINELIHRGETFETAAKVAEKVIQKSKEKANEKKGLKGHQK